MELALLVAILVFEVLRLLFSIYSTRMANKKFRIINLHLAEQKGILKNISNWKQ